MLELLIPIGAAFLGAMAAIGSAFLAHRYSFKREQASQRRDLRAKYLIDAYRELAISCNRPLSADNMDDFRRLERALEDIQLFGLPEHIELVRKFSEEFTRMKSASVDPLLFALRETLRRELGMEPDRPPKIWHLRVERNEERILLTKGNGSKKTSI